MAKRLPKGYKCPKCNRRNQFSLWVYAHAHEQIIHTCECGARNIIDDLKCVGTEEVSRPPLRAK